MHQLRARLVLAALLSSIPFAAPAAAQDAPAETIPPPRVETAPPPRVETAPPPRVETSPPPSAAEVGPDTASCAADAYARARGSVVTVVSAGRSGAGVLVLDGGHVATALSIVDQGHGIDITDADGNRRHARIVLTADEDGLAMLELDAPLPGRPLGIADWDGVEVGRRVVVLGVPGHDAPRGAPAMARGTMPWAASEGIVSARGDRAIQTDAAIQAPIGSPIVSCDGELVAMVGRMHETMTGTYTAMPGAPALTDLVSRSDHPEGYGGRWSVIGGLSIAGAYEDPQWLWGGGLTLGVIGLDAFVLAGRFHYFRNDDSPLGTDVISIVRERLRGDAYVGWRQIVTFGRFAMHFELALGASVTRWQDNERRGEIIDVAGTPTLRWTETSRQDWSVRPMGVVNLIHGAVILSYTFEVDIDREHVVHVFDLGIRL